MRKNTQQAYEAWKTGKAKKPASAIWTDGENIYSYGARIVWREGGRVMFNADHYSSTTSCQQNGLRVLLSRDGISYDSTDPMS